jgi:signal transduction histidine kinase
LVTLLAYEALTAQLIDLQRNRLTRSRALDTRARRTLHDEVLPNLHTTLIELSDLAGQHPSAAHAVDILKQAHAQIADLIHDAGQDFPAPLKYQRVEDALRDLIATEFRGEFDRVSWEIAPDLPPLDPVPAEAIFGAAREAIRNAAVHGRGGDVTQPLHLKVCLRCEDHRLTLVVEDDGVGPDRGDPEQAIPRGSQSGLTLYHTLMTVLGGYVELRSLAEGGTQVQIILPLE